HGIPIIRRPEPPRGAVLKTYLIVPFLLLAAALSSCDGRGVIASIATPSPQPTPAPFISATKDAPVIIAVSAPLSGDQQAVGQDLQLAAQMAIDDYGGALAGHAVTLAARDDTCADPQSAVTIARDLIAAPALLGVVGPMCTIGAQAANPLYGEAGVVHIAPSATRGELSHQG